MGQFLGPTEIYSTPVNLVHPPDNDVAKSRYHPSLLDPRYELTEEQQRELQDQIDELFAVLRIIREMPQ